MAMSKFAKTPKPPYYAVIFTTLKSENQEGYPEMNARMFELAGQQKGYLGIESAKSEIGISVTYWETLEDIARWKNHAEHQIAQGKGYEVWYKAFATRVCLVERDNIFEQK
ncbi:MAG TPA: antibiotic biosynthesis monooxygenase [Pyrinomonadaceae bacterium]|nr:antibiotic biosynthesis monooxygenase [Pyrinomonadaceae bacterium]